MKLPLSVADRGVVHAVTSLCLSGFSGSEAVLAVAAKMMPSITRENPSMIAIMTAVTSLNNEMAAGDHKQIVAARSRLRVVLNAHHATRAADACDSLFTERN